MLKTSNMQSAIVSNRLILGVVAFGASFGLGLVFSWDLKNAFLTGIITIFSTYLAALFIDKRRRASEMLVLDSLHRRIKELEGLKSRIVAEVNQLESHHSLLYQESNKLQNQIVERRNQRDSLNRELSSYVTEKKQLEAQISQLHNEIQELEKAKLEHNNSLSAINAEKRRLELSCSVSKAEINQLNNQLCELLQQRQDLESNITLLERLKPQLEEKLYEMRLQVQELEAANQQQNQLLIDKKLETENIELNLNSLKAEVAEQQNQIQQLQSQISLLQDERDHLQSQVWELLQQIENLDSNKVLEKNQEEDVDVFPFADLLDTVNDIDESNILEGLSSEWTNFLAQISDSEIQALKAMIEDENPHSVIKKIAEANITMPNLLIDSINEKANNTIGELIIDPNAATPEIYPEYQSDVKRAIATYKNIN
ncbi:tellurite resistance TerB C-terminal domain-containing protein [Fischerella thermalis]|nr:tellurite resistance TerB C-terminal domain-containing protein [Fischerella thermalis]